MRRFSRPCSGVAKTNADSGATLLDEPADFYRPRADRNSEARPPRPARAQAEPDDDAEQPFLRARRRVPIRRGWLPAWTRTLWGRLALAAALVVAVGLVLALLIEVRLFLDHDPRFRIESSASIQTLGNSQLSRADLLSVFGSDIGRNLFYVPLAKRRAELEQIPWVRQATVMRVLPNQIRVAIVERQPIAFVALRGRVALVDAAGVILHVTPDEIAARHYSFPVVDGIDPADPLPIRAARMQLYQRFMAELDSTGEHFSAQLSEVDLSDPEDLRTTVPVAGADLLLHFGNDDFLPRWRNYQAHIAQWRQQYPHLASVDLRYDREVVLKMAGDPGTTPGAKSPAPAAKPTAPAAKSRIPARNRKAVPEHKVHAAHAAAHPAPHRPRTVKHAAPGKTTHSAQDPTRATRRPA